MSRIKNNIASRGYIPRDKCVPKRRDLPFGLGGEVCSVWGIDIGALAVGLVIGLWVDFAKAFFYSPDGGPQRGEV